MPIMTCIKLPKLMRRHIPTGIVAQCKWMPAQHPVLSDPAGFPARTLEKVCVDLVIKWNRQQPKNWFYWLEAAE